MPRDIFEERRKGLEEEFFAKREQQLVQKLRETLEKEQPRETLRELTGIQDEAVLDTLVKLHVNRDTLAAFALYPLVEVAWADGKVDESERKAFLEAAAAQGIEPDHPGHQTLREFLKERPREDARKAWYAWAEQLKSKLSLTERRKLREALVARARQVAEASGGILGLGRRISANEQKVLDAIERTFAD
ncbi:MAG TPA: TerB family tellurite resistance protein [Candidatus Limnocylindria bacterium]|nr:TerB family tellurite resistance protein [Candidatus Limnocylindria bacterium]